MILHTKFTYNPEFQKWAWLSVLKEVWFLKRAGSTKHYSFQGKASWNLTFWDYLYSISTNFPLYYPCSIFPCQTTKTFQREKKKWGRGEEWFWTVCIQTAGAMSACVLKRKCNSWLSGLRLFAISAGCAPSPAKSLPSDMTGLLRPLLEIYRIYTSWNPLWTLIGKLHN